MRTRSLIVLALVTAVTVAAADWSSALRRGDALPPAGGPLVPGLADRVNGITRVAVEGQGGRVTLLRSGGGWGVAEKDGYPADTGLVKALVLGVAGARLVEPRTARPVLYPRLGVEDPQTAGAVSTGVTLEGDGAPGVGLVIGKAGSAPGTLYARRGGDATSWLVSAELPVLDTDPLHWIDPALPQVPRDAVASVEVRQPDGRAVTIGRAAPGQPFTASVPAAGAAVEALVEAVGRLVPLDVAKDDGGPAAVVTTVHRFDGTALVLRTVWRDGGAWVALDGRAGWRYRVSDALGRALTRPPEGFAEDAP